MDVKEAPEVPTEHPQWKMLDDEEDEQEAEGSDVSEFTTDEDVEDDQDWYILLVSETQSLQR